jgi:predicted ArsR family transcriptional regulator
MEEKVIYIDKDVPIEKQIGYLRKKFSHQAIRIFKLFRHEFGDRAEELSERLYAMYMEDTIRDYNLDFNNLPFDQVVALCESNEEDTSLGFMPEVIYKSSTEVHAKLGTCPYYEAAKRLDFHESVCKFNCELNAKYMTEHTAYKAEFTAKIAEGDEYCVMKIAKKKTGEE